MYDSNPEIWPTISIITVARNEGQTIVDTLESVAEQSYPNIQHIVIDGGSTDDTWPIVKAHRHQLSYASSERDSGIYDGMNKGLGRATGDIIGFLNAGDRLSNAATLSNLVTYKLRTKSPIIYGDVLFVSPHRTEKTVRYWRAGKYRRERFRRGWSPPHLSTYVDRSLYDLYGGFRTDLKIAADYELLLRFMYVHRVDAEYVPEIITIMRASGVSNRNLSTISRANWEAWKSWKLNGMRPPVALPLIKPVSKILQIWKRP